MNNPIVFIPLRNSTGTTVVDFEDFDKVRDRRWGIDKSGYVHCYKPCKPKSVKVYLHRCITGAPVSMDVDHADHNRLNNSKSNLRVCSKSNNLMNRLKGQSFIGQKMSSQFKGVCWSIRDGRWVSTIKHKAKQIHLGHYASETEAARAYNLKAKELFGEFALLNDVPDGPMNRIKRGKYRMNRKKSP